MRVIQKLFQQADLAAQEELGRMYLTEDHFDRCCLKDGSRAGSESLLKDHPSLTLIRCQSVVVSQASHVSPQWSPGGLEFTSIYLFIHWPPRRNAPFHASLRNYLLSWYRHSPLALSQDICIFVHTGRRTALSIQRNNTGEAFLVARSKNWSIVRHQASNCFLFTSFKNTTLLRYN